MSYMGIVNRGADAAGPGIGADYLARLLARRTGQHLAADRAWRIETALRPLLVEQGAADIDRLVDRIRTDPALADRAVDLLLNQETSFFRDAGPIDQAVESFLALSPRPRPRIWCAACATGQEPLSVAMLLAERGDTLPEILATDISAAAVARARTGTYTQFEIQRGLPVRRMVRWFEGEGNRWTAAPALLSTIAYRRQNLVADPFPAGTFDLILCRNVLFYLTPPARERVLEGLARALTPDGYLLLGAGETVIGQSALLRPSRRARGLYERA